MFGFGEEGGDVRDSEAGDPLSGGSFYWSLFHLVWPAVLRVRRLLHL
jgi:hypothetical protein